MSSYVYSPVDSNAAEIRLLTISFDVRQVLGHQNPKPLSGRLTTHKLPVSGLPRAERLKRSAKLPFFSALSYVWGNGCRSHEILVDGKQLLITANLYTALRDLQSSSSLGDIRVWVDAICINQEDQGERSAQIHLMREIYHMSAFVRIWLGPSSPEARKCARFIAHLADTNSSPDDHPTDGKPSKIEETIYKGLAVPIGPLIDSGIAFGQNIIQLMDIISPSYRDGKAHMLLDTDENSSLHQETINELAKWRPSARQLEKVADYGDFKDIGYLINKVLIEENSWFERMWVVQEVGVAQTVEFQIGNYALDWDRFVCAIHYLHYVRNVRIPCIRRVTGLEKIRMGFNDGKRQPLRDLIRETRFRRATDPRDKVYSLLGLMGDPLTEYLMPDYSKSVNEVYTNATLHFIQQKNSLDPICGQQVAGGRDGLPCWVPNYSLSEGESALPLVTIDSRESLYAASGYDHRSNFISSRSGFGKKLPTNGVYIDTVIEDSEFGYEREDYSSNSESLDFTLSAASRSGRLQALSKTTACWLHKLSYFISQCNAGGQALPNHEHFDLFNNLPPRTEITEISLMSKVITTLLLGRISPRERLLEERVNTIICYDPSILVKGSFQSSKTAEDLAGPKLSRTSNNTTRSKSKSTETNRWVSSAQPPKSIQIEKPNAFSQICQSINKGMHYRRFVVTKNSHLGAIPQHTRAGDIICVLFGCSVPVVLRRREKQTRDASGEEQKLGEKLNAIRVTVEEGFNGDKELNDIQNQDEEEYTFIGECYLHNFMDGEAIVLLVKGERQVQKFILS